MLLPWKTPTKQRKEEEWKELPKQQGEGKEGRRLGKPKRPTQRKALPEEGEQEQQKLGELLLVGTSLAKAKDEWKQAIQEQEQ